MNKNNFTISSEDIDKIRNYIEQTNETNSNLRDANSIDVILKKYEDDMIEHSNEVRHLNKKIQTRDERISDLENRLEFSEDTIDMLEDKVSKLQEALDYFKELWKKFIKFLQDKFLIPFLGVWEELNNENFKVVEFVHFKNEAGRHAFTMSPQKWIRETNLLVLFLNRVNMVVELLQEVILLLSLLVGLVLNLNYI